jgi:hypothetical protein
MDAMMIGAPFGLAVLIALGVLLAVMNHLSQWKGTQALGIWSPKHQRKKTYCQDHETTDDCCPGCRITTKFDAVPSKVEGGDCHHQN